MRARETDNFSQATPASHRACPDGADGGGDKLAAERVVEKKK